MGSVVLRCQSYDNATRLAGGMPNHARPAAVAGLVRKRTTVRQRLGAQDGRRHEVPPPKDGETLELP
jgi:hypothetical protein